MEISESLSGVMDSVNYVFANYGWHLLIACIILGTVYHKLLRQYIEKYKEYKFEQEYSAKYHKNPDIFAAHVNAQQCWAEKMQEKYNRESEEHHKKQKEKEEKIRQEFIEKYGNDGGHILGGTQDDNKSNNLRPEYNPLMGNGSSSTYRPPRRSPCGGGGCGR